MNQAERFRTLVEQMTPTSRREFLKRSAIMGATLPVFGTLLSACGGDDGDGSSGETTETSGESDATPEGRGQVPGPSTATPSNEDATGEATEAEDSATEAGGSETEDATAGGAEGEPKQGGTLILLGNQAFEGLSPDYTGPSINWAIITQMHNAMVEMDPWFEYQPILSESWDVNDDATQYTFHLRQDVLFHDGEPFNAEDVKYTFDYYGNPDNAAVTGSDFVNIESVEATDDYTVDVAFSAPNAAFLSKAGSYFIVASHVHSELGEDGYARAPVGTGAFKLKDFVPDSHVEVEAFPDHFRGAPYLDGVRINNVPEPSVRAIALETGEADSSVWTLSTSDILNLRDKTDQFTVLVSQNTSCNAFPLAHQSDQFKEKAVRQALMHAINRDSIVNDIWNGLSVRAETNLSPALAYWFDDSEVKKYEYDPDKAAQLLDEAGWVVAEDGIRAKDGVRLAWTCVVISGEQGSRMIAEAVQQWVAEVGCQMEILESPTVTDRLRNQDVEMGLFVWTYGGSGGDPDAMSVLHSDFTSNRTYYKNPEMDKLLEAGLAEPDPEKRKAIYKDVQKLFCEDVPVFYLQYRDGYTFYRKRIKGLPEEVLSAGTTYNMANTFWIDESNG